MKHDISAQPGYKPNAPERIYGWLNNQMSVARHYGGLKYMGHDYIIAEHEPQQPLVRLDVVKREVLEAKDARKAIKQFSVFQANKAQGELI